jgi:CRISPR/Cas system-associated exonuclease Cas4 (RecB family)
VRTTINKSDWLTARQCLTMAWYGLRDTPAAPNEAGRFRMEQGQEIGALAQKLYPKGILVFKTEGESVAEVTQKLISDDASEIFEAAFRARQFTARADILQRQDDGWHVLEVKSRFSDTDKIKDLIDDLAYTVMVARRSGLSVKAASLVLLSREYRFGAGPEALFHRIESTTEVFERTDEFEADADSIASALFGDQPPDPKLVSACRDCSYFETKCLGAGIEHTVLDIPALHHKKLKRLSDDGIVDLANLPEDIDLNERQERARGSALSGNRVVEPTLRVLLDGVTWPCFYLDFETVATALPLYDGHACHQQVLTQFSVHRRDAIDGEIQHCEYLADASHDCQRGVAAALVEALGERGSIIVYSGFEKTRINALRTAFPEFAEPLSAVLDRLIDLLPFVTDHVYHPDFKGSFSIKNVLPALVPDLSYKGLAVGDGDTAIARFARMARGEITGEAIKDTREALLAYCKLDTLAMVRLHEALFQLATRTRHAGGN